MKERLKAYLKEQIEIAEAENDLKVANAYESVLQKIIEIENE